tara:strand:+ start:363 stop:554 length:192 start_codon:yes stop_codon:yes gene_type:complete
MTEETITPEQQVERLNNIVQALIAQRNSLSDQLVMEQVKVAELQTQLANGVPEHEHTEVDGDN